MYFKFQSRCLDLLQHQEVQDVVLSSLSQIKIENNQSTFRKVQVEMSQDGCQGIIELDNRHFFYTERHYSSHFFLLCRRLADDLKKELMLNNDRSLEGPTGINTYNKIGWEDLNIGLGDKFKNYFSGDEKRQLSTYEVWTWVYSSFRFSNCRILREIATNINRPSNCSTFTDSATLGPP